MHNECYACTGGKPEEEMTTTGPRGNGNARAQHLPGEQGTSGTDQTHRIQRYRTADTARSTATPATTWNVSH